MQVTRPTDFEACINACEACVLACVDAVREFQLAPEADVMVLTLECAQVCELAVTAMERGGALAPHACSAAAKLCARAAAECGRHRQAGSRACARACSRAARECGRVTAARRHVAAWA